MRFTLQYPIAHAGYSPALLAADGMRKVVAAAEAAGFDSIAFTEHPAPSQVITHCRIGRQIDGTPVGLIGRVCLAGARQQFGTGGPIWLIVGQSLVHRMRVEAGEALFRPLRLGNGDGVVDCHYW